MPLYVKADRKEPLIPTVRTFYADDSTCEIAGRKHTLIGAVGFTNEAEALGRMLQCKRDLGIGTSDEINWNSGKFTPEQRRFITDALLPVLSQTVGFLIVMEGHDKQAGAARLMKQLSHYCLLEGFDAFVVVLDKNIVQNSRNFDSEISAFRPECMGWSEVDSAHNPLIQLADLFCGFQKLRLDVGTGRVNGSKLVSVEMYEGELQECELAFHLFAALRYSLWGKIHDYGWDPDSDTRPEPFKHNLGYGVRAFSTVGRAHLLNALSHLDREFMGCIH